MDYDISIIIVNFNTKALVKNLLSSIFKSNRKIKVEIIVVDNGSWDGSQEYIKSTTQNLKLKFILNKQNLGYSAANNQAIKISHGRYLLFFNSDTLLVEDTLGKMVRFMDEEKEYGAATCKIELADGKLDMACHRGFPTPWAALTYFSGLEKIFPNSKIFAQYHQGWKKLNSIHKIDVISGAFFMIRREILDKVGYFDEQFFMYGEDIDLCYRIHRLGYKICFYPNTKVIHYKKQSGRDKKFTQKDKKIIIKSRKYFYETMKIFYDKHYKNKYPWLLRQLVLLGIWLISRLKR